MPTITTGPLGLIGALGAVSNNKASERQQENDALNQQLALAEEARRAEAHRLTVSAAEAKAVEAARMKRENDFLTRTAIKIQESGQREALIPNTEDKIEGMRAWTVQVADKFPDSPEGRAAKLTWLVSRDQSMKSVLIDANLDKLRAQIHTQMAEGVYGKEPGEQLDGMATLLQEAKTAPPEKKMDALRKVEAMDEKLRASQAASQQRAAFRVQQLDWGRNFRGYEDQLDADYRNNVGIFAHDPNDDAATWRAGKLYGEKVWESRFGKNPPGVDERVQAAIRPYDASMRGDVVADLSKFLEGKPTREEIEVYIRSEMGLDPNSIPVDVARAAAGALTGKNDYLEDARRERNAIDRMQADAQRNALTGEFP